MQKEDLSEKIIYELDMIRIISNMSVFAILNDSEDINLTHYKLIFEDIEKRCNNISEKFEKLEEICANAISS